MKESVHPMVAVPDAIRIVLTETCRVLIQQTSEDQYTEDVSPHGSFQKLGGRVLAHNVVMREPGYPPYTASIMDGFAVHSTTDTTNTTTTVGSDWTHVVKDKVYAGDAPGSASRVNTPASSELLLPAAYYVTTGAVIPAGCDCVVPIEDVIVSKDQSHVKIPPVAQLVPHKWIRAPGCDIAAGSTVLQAGSVLDPIALGLLLQSGVTSVRVRRTITVGVLSTGSELLSSDPSCTQDWWKDLAHGAIPDVNRPILLSLLSAIPNINVVDLGMVRDDNVDAMVERIQSAAKDCDVILTTGGISMGETDIVEHVLVERLQGRLHFGRLHMKPGKPTTFVTVQNRLVFAMPGNPVSAVVCTQLLVTPCLQLLTNGADTAAADTHSTANVVEQIDRMVDNAQVHAEVQAELTHDVRLDPERPEYHRVTINRSNGAVNVTSTGVQQSSRLMSLRGAQGLLVLPQATAEHPIAKAGETYTLLISATTDRVLVRDSKHLKGAKKPMEVLKIGIVQIAPEDAVKNDLAARVEKALSGSKSGSVSVTSSRTYSGPVDRFYNSIEEDDVDILVAACPKVPGSFRCHVKLASLLRQNLSKVADAMALQARQGAASQYPTAALFEVVIGYRPDGKGSIVILLPEEGLDEGLGNVRGLLKHALQTARGDRNQHSHDTHSHVQQ
jgi:molybdopterin molybdotransferase